MATNYSVRITGNKTGGPQAAIANNGIPNNAGSSFRKRFTTVPKNIIKSTGNLTAEVIGSYLPNVGSIAEMAGKSREEAVKSFSKSLNTVKGVFAKSGANAPDSQKNPVKYLQDAAKETFNDTVSRLKQGKFYRSQKEKDKENEAAMSKALGLDEFDGFGGDMTDGLEGSGGGGNIAAGLSSEPFGKSLTSAEKRSLGGNARAGRRARPARGNTAITVNNAAPGAAELTLGDKLVSDIIRHGVTAIVGEQEKLFDKQFAADEIRHVQLINYQDSILKGVNAIALHLDAVESRFVEDTLRYQDDSLKKQEDTVALLQELKQAVIVTSPGYEEEMERRRSKFSKITSGPNNLNREEYAKNVKGNLMDMVYRSPFGMLLGITPSIAGMLDSQKSMGMKTKFDPLSGLLRMGINSLISRETRGKLSSLNDIAGNLGPLLTGQMNRMARFGNSAFSRTAGQLFGVKNTFAEKMDTGLKDPAAAVSWSAKSDRTLNVVIPGYLSKISAALTGSEETFYDYNTGKFRRNSSLQREYERMKKTASYDTVLASYAEEMAGQWKNTAAAKKMPGNMDESAIRGDIDKIIENISKTGFPYSPEYIQDKEYREQLLAEVKDKRSFSIFDELYNKLDPVQQATFNSRTQVRNKKYEEALLDFNKDILQSGGSSAIQNTMAQEEMKRIEYQIAHSPHLKIDGLDKDSPLFAMRLKAIQEAEQKLESLKTSSVTQVNAVRINEDGTAGVEGAASRDASSTSMVGVLNNIHSLLSQGILVFPRKLGKNQVPDHLRKIFSANKARAEELSERSERERREAESGDESIYGKSTARMDISRRWEQLAFATFGDIAGDNADLEKKGFLGKFARFMSKNKKKAADFNIVDRLANFVADTGIQGAGTLFNAQGTAGTGLFGGKTEYERAVSEFSGQEPAASSKRPRKTKASKIKNAVGRAYNKFYGKYMLNTESMGSSEGGREELLLMLYGELREEGIPEDESMRILSDISGEPSGEGKEEVSITAGEVAEVTGVPEEAVEKKIGKKTSSAALKEGGMLKGILPAKIPSKEELSDIVQNMMPKVQDAAASAKNAAVKAGRKARTKAKGFMDAGGRLQFDEQGDIVFDENYKIKLTGEGLGHKALRFGKEKAESVIAGFKGGDREKARLEAFLKENPAVGKLVAKINRKQEVISSFNDLNLYVTEHPRTKLAKEMKNASPVNEPGGTGAKALLAGTFDELLNKARVLFGGSGQEEEAGEESKENAAKAVPGIKGLDSRFAQFGSLIKTKLNGLIKPPEESDEKKQEHQLAVTTYNILEETVQELAGSSKKEPSFDDIEQAVDKKIKAGQVDKDIAREVLKKAKAIGKDKDKDANPLNAYYSAIYELKESYNTKYRKDHSIVRNIVKNITKSGIKGIAATTLLVTGHPVMAAMLAFGPKNTVKGVKAGIKGAIKSSKVLAGLSAKVLGIAGKMAPGIAKTGLGVIGKILGGDIFDGKPKKTREDYEREKEAAALAFTALEGLHREIMETNPDASLNDIKKAVGKKVKQGSLDKEIADAVIKATEANAKDKDADATPLGAFLQAILALKKQYSKEYRKGTSVFRKIALGILKGVGKGIGAAALLMSGHPIMAAALALSGPAKLVKSLRNKFGKKAGPGGEAIPEANPITKERKETLENARDEVSGQAEEAKEGLFKKIPAIASGAAGGLGLGVSKARSAVSSAFSGMKDNVTSFFDKERKREGSALDRVEDRKEERRREVQDKTLEVLEEIRDNTHDTEDEIEEKEERQKSLFEKIFKRTGSPEDGGQGGGAGLKTVVNTAIGAALKGAATKGLGALAGKGGVAGSAAKGLSSLFHLGGAGAGTAAATANTLGKAGSLGGKITGLLGKAGSAGGKAASALGKAGSLGGKAAGLAGKAGGVLGKAGGVIGKFAPALGGIAKAAGPIGLAITAAQAIGGGVKGWKNAAQIAGLEEGQEATLGQKAGSALSGGLGSLLTLGGLTDSIPLLNKVWNQDKLTKGIYSFGKNVLGKDEPELDENGNPVIGPDGKPVMKKRGLAANLIRNAAPLGLAVRAGQALSNKGKGAGAAGKESGHGLNEGGIPELDGNGNPLPAEAGGGGKAAGQDGAETFAEKMLRPAPAGLAAGGHNALRGPGAGILRKKDENMLNAGAEGASEGGKAKKKKSAGALLADIHSVLSKGIIVFPSALTDKNAPEYLKEALKAGKFQSQPAPSESQGRTGGSITGRSSSLFSRGKEAVSGAFKRITGPLGNAIGRLTGGGSPAGGGETPPAPGQGGTVTASSSGQGGSNARIDLGGIKDPKQASVFFYNNEKQVSGEIENMINNGEYGEIEKLADKLEDPSSMGQNKSLSTLSPEFESRVRNFINSPEAREKGVGIREAGRSPLTQLAYFTPGRARDEQFIHRMFKKAGFKNGAWNTKSQVTQTMGSKHFLGNAVDIEDRGKGESFYRAIAPVAKKYGLAWGGDWSSFKDYPHFELPENDKAIGYKGPPKENAASGEVMRRADGYGDRHNAAGIVQRDAVPDASYRQNDNYPKKAAGSITRLNESPIVTSDKMLISQINNAINIQKAIHDEQKRHNNVTEDFFASLMKIMQGMALSGSSPKGGGGLTESQIREINSLSAIMERERAAKEYFSSTARQMAEGF
jgi:hypothetical protein